MERRNFSAAFKSLQKECAQAIVDIFNQYGINELVLIEPMGIGEYLLADAVRLNNVGNNFLYDWFKLHAEDDDSWFSPDGFEGSVFNFARLYNLITDTIDCLEAKGVPVEEWNNINLVEDLAEECSYTVTYAKGQREKRLQLSATSEEDAKMKFERDTFDENYRIIKITKD